MRYIGFLFIALGVGLLLTAGVSRLSAEYGVKCQIVDNTACTGQDRSFCGVQGSICKKCDPHPRKDCLPMPEYSCYWIGTIFCTGRQVGQCLPNPSNPSQTTCQNWTYDGDCAGEPTCL